MAPGPKPRDTPFDVYVSYAEADRDWVETELTPRLAAASIRVCLEDDLALGGFEIEERSRAVAASRRTLLVITEAYLMHRWALSEQAVATELDPSAQKRRVIPVLRTDHDLPLRIRPLVAVDLRPSASARRQARQWRRLLEAVDPQRPGDSIGLVSKLSLRLAEATDAWVAPRWHGAGAAWLLVAYCALAASLGFWALLLWEMPTLRSWLLASVAGPLHAVGWALWREDRDALRRVSQIVGRSRRLRGAIAAGLVGVAGAWAAVGIPRARAIDCGPLGCPEDGVLYVLVEGEARVEAEAAVGDGPAVNGWSDSTRDVVTQKLQAVGDSLRALGTEQAPLDELAARWLHVGYGLAVRTEADRSRPVLTATLHDRATYRLEQATVLGMPGEVGISERLALQQQLVLEVLDRLGVVVDEAMSRRLAAVPTDSPLAAAQAEEGFEALQRGDLDAARSLFEAALALDPSFSAAWSNLAAIATREGRLHDALAARQRAVDGQPAYAPFHYNLGHLQASLGQLDRARISLETALRLDRAHVAARNELAKVLLEQGQAEAAAEELERALWLDGDAPMLHKNLGRARLAAAGVATTSRAAEPAAVGIRQAERARPKQLRHAVTALERALALYPDDDWLGRVEAGALLTAAHAAAGRPDAACAAAVAVRRLDAEHLSPWNPWLNQLVAPLPCSSIARMEDAHA